MIVIPLPEIEGPDGPEEHQQRTRNEDHGSDLEQARRAGGFHGHGGVRLQGRRGTGRRRATDTPVPVLCPRGTLRTGVGSFGPSTFRRHLPRVPRP